MKDKRYKHGLSKDPIYPIWKSMRQRCKNPKYKEFYYYGGRGICVCKEWDNFETFKSDMGNRPDGFYLDRIDTNGNYCKENCKWVSGTESAINRRRPSSNAKYRGVYKSSRCNSYEAQIRINDYNYYIGSFRTAEEARDAHLLVHKEWYGIMPVN